MKKTPRTISRTAFWNAIKDGWKTWGYASSTMWNPETKCGCAFGVAGKKLRIDPWTLAEAVGNLKPRVDLGGRIMSASDKAGSKEKALEWVRKTIMKDWPPRKRITV